MASSKLYLVRHEVESFIGPLTAAEFGRNLSRLSIGMHDEVSSHCGPWVFIDDRERMKKHYPELLTHLKDAMSGGWVADAGAFKNEATIKGSMPLTTREPDRRMLFAAAFFGLATLAAIVAWILAGTSELSSRIVGGNQPVLQDALNLLNSGRDQEFISYLEPHATALAERSGQNKEHFTSWIPVLRAYAFMGSGELSGLSGKKLRGEAGIAAPADCSLQSWKKRWREAAPKLADLTSGKALPSDHWARVLAWDPWWVRRRSQAGWLRPRNYYEGCLAMAAKALDLVISEGQKTAGAGALSAARSRIEFQRAILAGNANFNNASMPPDNLGLWTCLDSAADRPALDACLDRPWQNLMLNDYNREKFYWAVLRVAVNSRRLGDRNAWSLVRNELQAFLERRDSGDSFTRIDYADELRFVGRGADGALPASLDGTPPMAPSMKSLVEDVQVDMAH
ncbi:MAG: hypothetical protein RIQ81_994 [Pseudomonadota bacterium]|jgi:hypothetical protein